MRDEIKVWWEQSQADIKTAEIMEKEGRYYASVFFCHQAVEKSLKALFLKKSRNPQASEMFSHSLIFLGKSAKIPKNFHSFLRDLTPEYVNTRYPTAAEEPPETLYDKDIASRTVSGGKEVIEWISKHL